MPNKLTTKDFIERAKKLHGEEQYDYSKVIYEGSGKPVRIICKDHGEFLQIAHSHLRGQSCKECAKVTCSEKLTMTTDTFIRKSKEKHGERYDYSKAVYEGNKASLTIICSVHGEFQQRANGHLNGNGCPKCGQCSGKDNRSIEPRNLCTETSILNRLREVHGDKYNLSQVRYINTRTKITLICSTHGAFQILPGHAIRLKQGCNECGRLRAKISRTKTNEQFIAECTAIHGNHYDYSQVVYKGSEHTVGIVCHVHGIFHQEAQIHLRGHGCPDCGGGKQLTTEIFIQRSTIIHKNRYDYSETVYTKNNEKIKYNCVEHGAIEQIALSHLAGKGCWKCFSKGYSKSAIAWLEYVAVRDGITIEHALNVGEHQIRDSRYKADGYNPITGKVYEFMGDFHHSNPTIYARDQWHTLKKKTCGEVYDDTMERLRFIENQGYDVEVIWESDWKVMQMAAKRISNYWKAYKGRRSR